MKLFNKLLLLTLLVPTISYAQDNISQSTGIIGNGRLLGAQTFDGQSTVGVLGIDSDGNTTLEAMAGSSVKLPALDLTDDLVYSADDFTIKAAVDTNRILISGGSAASAANGSYIALHGDSHSGAGAITLATSSDGAADVNIYMADDFRILNYTGSTEIWRFTREGSQMFYDDYVTIGSSSGDGSDNDTLCLAGGGSCSMLRGGFLEIKGNEVSGVTAGRVTLASGNAATADLNFYAADDFFFLDDTGAILLTIDDGGDIIAGTGNTSFYVGNSTTDGSDSNSTTLVGGGEIDQTRGAYIAVRGNEASSGGSIQIYTGDAGSSGDIHFRASDTFQFQNAAGTGLVNITADGDIELLKNNYTFNFLGSMGTSTTAPQTDAPDDWVQIQINGAEYYLPAYLPN